MNKYKYTVDLKINGKPIEHFFAENLDELLYELRQVVDQIDADGCVLDNAGELVD